MTPSHYSCLSPCDHHVLQQGLIVARLALEGPLVSARSRGRGVTCAHITSTRLTLSSLCAMGRDFRVEFRQTRDLRRIEIHNLQSAHKTPLLTIEEALPSGIKHPAADHAAFHDHVLRLQHLCDHSARDGAEYWSTRHRQGRLVGALLLACGVDPSLASRLIIQLPNIYREGRQWANVDEAARLGPDVLAAIDAALEGPYRAKIMQAAPTAVITSQWWNAGSVTRQRCLFDMSAVAHAQVIVPSPIETMRLLAA